MKRKFLINPHSGRGVVLKHLRSIRDFFEREEGGFDYTMTRSSQEATEVTRQSLHQGYEQIVVLGGDGSVNACVNGFFESGKLISSTAKLALSNWGSGSDYFRTLVSKSPNLDWKRLVLNHQVRRVDLGRVRFKSTQKLFINSSSVGMSAMIAGRKENNPKWIPLGMSYVYPTLKSLPELRASEVEVIADETRFQSKVLGIFVSKGMYAGGGMKLGGGVEVDDGFFDVKVIGSMSVAQILRRLPLLYSGDFSRVPEIKTLRAKNIKIVAKESLPVECEGEISGEAPCEYHVEPVALSVCWPRT